MRFIYPYSSVLLHWHWGNESYVCPSATEVILKDVTTVVVVVSFISNRTQHNNKTIIEIHGKYQ